MRDGIPDGACHGDEMSPILPIIVLGLAALLLGKRSSATTSNLATSSGPLPMVGPSGHNWLIELIGKSGVEGSYVVYEPAQVPVHDKYPVLQFSQLADSPLRRLVAKYPSVPSDIYKLAVADFYVGETF